MIVGILKPKGPTSHDIINRIRMKKNIQKVGHAGTLDPLASGVLVVGIGRNSTKKLHTYVKGEKEYKATIRLGQFSSTDDEEGTKKDIAVNKKPTKRNIEDVINTFIGTISQQPPIYSAVKIKGKEAYKYARKNQEVYIKPRNVIIKHIEIEHYSWPMLQLKVISGSGVYIRSLARDIGRTLGTGGYIFELVRTRVGKITIDNCINIQDLK